MIDVVDIAKVCHEANRSLCDVLGDIGHVSWDEAPDWLRDSVVNGVRFNLENPDAPASESHATGWKYGPVNDAEKKEHPCFVPYQQLPVEHQAKDHLFKAVCGALSGLVR